MMAVARDSITGGSDHFDSEEDHAALDARLKKILTDEVTEDEIELRHKIKENPEKNFIQGLAILNEYLFVARDKSSDLDVYNCNNFHESKILRVESFVSSVDMCACNINNCLCILNDKGERSADEILRINSDGEVLKRWPTTKGFSLSSGTYGNVIVTACYEDLLLEYSPNGDLLREINLPCCEDPLHAIKVNNARYIVSHRVPYNEHRLCLVDEDGNVKRSFGRGTGSEIDQLNYPYHFAAVNNGYVIVADCFNHRLLLLDSNLEFKTKFVPKCNQKFQRPCAVCLSGTLLVVLLQEGGPDNSTTTEADDSRKETEDGDTSTINNEMLLAKACRKDTAEGETSTKNSEMLIEEDCRLLVFDIEPVLQKYFG